MHILISNDDGYKAEGLRALVKAFTEAGHRVTVCAPEDERSANSHAVTLGLKTVRCTRVDDIHGAAAYAVDGTPADCVKLALSVLCPAPIDMVVSGINKGRNLGTDVIYSGTVGAAVEAVICGVRGVAFSCFKDAGADMIAFGAEFAAKNAAHFCTFPMTQVLNVNFPDCAPQDVKGVKTAALGVQKYNDAYDYLGDGRYRLVSLPYIETPQKPTADLRVIKDNYITVTPVLLDHTDRKTLRGMDASGFVW